MTEKNKQDNFHATIHELFRMQQSVKNASPLSRQILNSFAMSGEIDKDMLEIFMEDVGPKYWYNQKADFIFENPDDPGILQGDIIFADYVSQEGDVFPVGLFMNDLLCGTLVLARAGGGKTTTILSILAAIRERNQQA